MALKKEKLLEELKALPPEDRKTLFDTLIEADPSFGNTDMKEIKELLSGLVESKKKTGKGKSIFSFLTDD